MSVKIFFMFRAQNNNCSSPFCRAMFFSLSKMAGKYSGSCFNLEYVFLVSTSLYFNFLTNFLDEFVCQFVPLAHVSLTSCKVSISFNNFLKIPVENSFLPSCDQEIVNVNCRLRFAGTGASLITGSGLETPLNPHLVLKHFSVVVQEVSIHALLKRQMACSMVMSLTISDLVFSATCPSLLSRSNCFFLFFSFIVWIMPLLIGSHTNIAGINCNCTFVIDSWECTGVLFFLFFFLFVSQASSAVLRDVVGHPCFLVNILLDRKFYFQESLAAFFSPVVKALKDNVTLSLPFSSTQISFLSWRILLLLYLYKTLLFYQRYNLLSLVCVF